MRELHFIHSNNSISENELIKTESELQIRFPDSYRDFLLKHNGGLSEEGVFDIQNRGQSSIIFYGINTGEDYSDLVINFIAYRKRLPDDTVPIGFDPGGNLICLVKINGDWKVFFWDHEVENDPPEISKMFFIKNSFSEFINCLESEDAENW
jgi:hypothetical protein